MDSNADNQAPFCSAHPVHLPPNLIKNAEHSNKGIGCTWWPNYTKVAAASRLPILQIWGWASTMEQKAMQYFFVFLSTEGKGYKYGHKTPAKNISSSTHWWGSSRCWPPSCNPNHTLPEVAHHSSGFNLLTPLGPDRSFLGEEWWSSSGGVWFGLQLGGQQVNSLIQCVPEEVFLQVFVPPIFFHFFSSVDRNTKVLHFFCSMVVAQPHICNIGQTGGSDNVVQFGHEKYSLCLFDCSAFVISLVEMNRVSRTESCLILHCSPRSSNSILVSQ